MASSSRWKATRNSIVAACLILAPGYAMALETSLKAPGAPDELRQRLENGSSAFAAKSRSLETPLELLSAALSDYRTLVQILYDEGYFSPVVNIRLDGKEAANIDPLNTPSSVNTIDITVKTGPIFRFGQADISPVTPETVIPDTYAVGQTAKTGAIRDAASAAVDAWHDAGHPKADIGSQNIRAQHANARLNAAIAVAPGPKLTFGKMHIQGESDVTPTSIDKIAGFPTGEVYSPAQVQKVGTRLRRTNAFNSVSLTEHDKPNPDGSLDFDATFEDLPKRRLTFGAELSSRNGMDLSANWIHRNLFGGAERFRFEARIRNIGGVEDIDGRIGMRLDRPDTLGPDDNTFYLAEIERRNRTHYNVTRGLVGIGARRTFSPKLYAEASFAFSYANSDDAFGSNRTFRYLTLPFRVRLDERDNKVSATRGFYVDARLTPFVGLSKTKSGGQLILDGRGYWDIGTEGRLVLAGRLQLGSVIGPALNEVSPDLLFFSGGAGTVRGQPYESLGIPVGSKVSGGRSFLGLTAEVRGKVTEKITLVGFYDVGTVGTDSFVASGSNSHSGAGLGVRYDVGGLGALRLDLAYPVNGSTGEGLQFYIGIGQAF
ncbi:BamA/TamA family outer membrane protein [Ruegeria litorea]|uniref:BamA/TamA family outer membrane protein n=1 Tax=Falsiruegeria litorea TaxID=1280831 RepID=A0ABS5WU31_9RHOB|nr:BamA/TamA family outer membrane protein [Falsiruegeria litorea]MBT3142639.1 BamA/TamA family outer membrane protein [Falsiruegeria litorea]